MNVASGLEGAASDRLLGKVLTRGRALRRRTRLIERAVIACFVVAIAAGAVVGATLTAHAPSSAPAATQPTPPAKTQYVQLTPIQVTASSSTPGHPAAAADDEDVDTYWASRRLTPSGVGVGQSLQVTFARSVSVAAVAMLSGAQFPLGSFSRAARPRTVELYFSSGPPLFWQLSDAPSLQTIKFAPRRTSSVRFVVLSVFAGTAQSGAYHVCAITEVSAYAAAKS